MFSSMYLIVSSLNIHIHKELTFVRGNMQWVPFHLFAYFNLLLPPSLVKENPLSNVLGILVKIQLSFSYVELISGFSILFHWSVCLFWFQYKVVFIIVALQYMPRSGSMLSPILFYFLKIVLAILGALWFQIIFVVSALTC